MNFEVGLALRKGKIISNAIGNFAIHIEVTRSKEAKFEIRN